MPNKHQRLASSALFVLVPSPPVPREQNTIICALTSRFNSGPSRLPGRLTVRCSQPDCSSDCGKLFQNSLQRCSSDFPTLLQAGQQAAGLHYVSLELHQHVYVERII